MISDKEKRKLNMYKVNFLSQMILGEIQEKDVKSKIDKSTYQEFKNLSIDDKYLKIDELTKEIYELT